VWIFSALRALLLQALAIGSSLLSGRLLARLRRSRHGLFVVQVFAGRAHGHVLAGEVAKALGLEEVAVEVLRQEQTFMWLDYYSNSS